MTTKMAKRYRVVLITPRTYTGIELKRQYCRLGTAETIMRRAVQEIGYRSGMVLDAWDDDACVAYYESAEVTS